MSHELSAVNLIAPSLIILLTGTLFVIFLKKRRDTRVHALDWMMAIFGSTALIGIAQLLKLLFHDNWSIFVPDSAPRALDIVTVVHLIALIILYSMSEAFLGDSFNNIRLAVMSVLVTLFFATGIFYMSSDQLILTKDIIPFANSTSGLDAFIFDIIQVYTVILIFYVFYNQYLISDNATIRRFLTILLAAIVLFLITASMEALEHLLKIPDVNAFLTALPTFLTLAYFYIKNPNFVYLAPANIAFLQIVSQDGNLLYAAELTEELNTTDFLVGPSLTSINTIISELVDRGSTQIELKQFVYTGGYILFEKVGTIKAILQTDRPSNILKRSMRYFIREFNREFHDQIKNYKGFIEKTNNGSTPDEIFMQCIPIVQSKVITSNFQE